MMKLEKIAWLQALAAAGGSLYFSQVLKFTPCTLCWYQRIFMYPLVFILFVGILRNDKKVYLYVLPLSLIGWLIALYHNFLQYKTIPGNIYLCTSGVSCTENYLSWFGFITIPFLSLIAFSIINLLMLLSLKIKRP